MGSEGLPADPGGVWQLVVRADELAAAEGLLQQIRTRREDLVRRIDAGA